MFFGDIDAQQWIPARQWHAQVPHATEMVLTATGSLTRFLERHFGLSVKVRLRDQFVDGVLSSESNLLDCPATEPILRRQVSLMYNNHVMIDAESVLPLDGVPAELMTQLESGDKPLGNLLIDRGISLARSDLSIARFVLPNGSQYWSRRSVLRSGSGTRALVVEFFHDAFWRQLARLTARS
ncbi:MAG: chorismate lyase [Mariprofundales bacterium]|nr:chorismate lyase [Mariprofundales bacterium]